MKTKAAMKTSGLVARDLGISMRQLDYLLLRRPDLTPRLVSGRRVWLEEDVEKVRQALAQRPRRTPAVASTTSSTSRPRAKRATA